MTLAPFGSMEEPPPDKVTALEIISCVVAAIALTGAAYLLAIILFA